MSQPGDPRRTRAWRKVRDQVIAEEPICWLQYPGICTTISTTGDHVIPVDQAPHLAMVRANLHGACMPCNRRKSNGNAPTKTTSAALTYFD